MCVPSPPNRPTPPDPRLRTHGWTQPSRSRPVLLPVVHTQMCGGKPPLPLISPSDNPPTPPSALTVPLSNTATTSLCSHLARTFDFMTNEEVKYASTPLWDRASVNFKLEE